MSSENILTSLRACIIEELHERGKTVEEISEELQVTEAVVRRALELVADSKEPPADASGS